MTDRRLAIDAWESLFRAQHEVFDEISCDFDDTALTQAEYDVLLTVTRGDEMTARLRDVTANMLISQPSVSRLVDRMAARGSHLQVRRSRRRPRFARARDARGRRGVPPGRLARTAGRSPSGCRCSDDDELAQLRDLTAQAAQAAAELLSASSRMRAPATACGAAA